MTKEEFMKKASQTSDWAPGRDAIDREFSRLYPGQKPMHLGTDMSARAMFGGNQYLDGCSIFDPPKGYQHIVTYGMSELYVNEELFYSKSASWSWRPCIKWWEFCNHSTHCDTGFRSTDAGYRLWQNRVPSIDRNYAARTPGAKTKPGTYFRVGGEAEIDRNHHMSLVDSFNLSRIPRI